MGKRDNHLSSMKGLAIIGVVAGHLGFPVLDMFVNYWHLPVFYFVSGYFFHEKHLNNWKCFLISRFNRLLIPFIVIAIIAITLHNPLVHIGLISGSIDSIEIYLSKIWILFATLSTDEQLVGAIWFLPSLFIVSLLALTICPPLKYLCKSTHYKWGG